MLRGAEVVGAGDERTDDGVLGGGGSAGVVADVEVGVGGFAVDRGRFIRMDEDVKEGEVAVGGWMLNGVLKVWAEGVHELVEGVCMRLITEGTDAVVHEVPVVIGSVTDR